VEVSNYKNDKILKAFGSKLKHFREEKKLSTRELADIAEIALSQVWVLESGNGNPTLTTLLAISKALNLTLNDLDPTQD
jgi:transcriptional regulator with XRE-family HTH domain